MTAIVEKGATRYTPWWAFAVAVLAALATLGLFVSAASHAPLVRTSPQIHSGTRGLPAQDGNLEFTVMDVQRNVPALGDPFYGATPAGTYTVVRMRVLNTSTEPVTFDGTYVLGIDQHGGRVTSDREAQYFANADGNGMMTRIAPGGAITTAIAFDVGSDQRLVGVQAHDSVFSRGADLPLAS